MIVLARRRLAARHYPLRYYLLFFLPPSGKAAIATAREHASMVASTRFVIPRHIDLNQCLQG